MMRTVKTTDDKTVLTEPLPLRAVLHDQEVPERSTSAEAKNYLRVEVAIECNPAFDTLQHLEAINHT